MSLTAYKIAGTGANNAGVGTNAWANPSRVTETDEALSIATTTSSTNGLKATNFGFTTGDVPADAIVVGINVIVTAQLTVESSCALRLVSAGGNSSGLSQVIPATGTIEQYTFSQSLSAWGIAADIYDSGWGCEFAGNASLAPANGASVTYGVDDIQMQIEYAFRNRTQMMVIF